MSIFVFPSELPEPSESGGYSETLATNIVRSSMDIGPDKVRRRQSRGVKIISCSYRLTSEQKEILEIFYNETLQGGNRYFNWRGLVVRFVEDDSKALGTFNYVANSIDMWDIDLTFEVEP